MIKLVMVGAYEGKTVVINGHKFVDGSLVLSDEPDKVANLVKYFSFFGAYPDGSSELEYAKFVIAEGGSDGGNTNVAGGGSNSSGTDTNKSTASDVSNGTGDVGATVSPADGGANGNGDSERRISDPRLLQIAAALKSLDPTVDDNWTDGGLPRVAAVESGSGIVGVTRKEINEALPDWSRDKASAALI